jgi:hypothetical protein
MKLQTSICLKNTARGGEETSGPVLGGERSSQERGLRLSEAPSKLLGGYPTNEL